MPRSLRRWTLDPASRNVCTKESLKVRREADSFKSTCRRSQLPSLLLRGDLSDVSGVEEIEGLRNMGLSFTGTLLIDKVKRVPSSCKIQCVIYCISERV